MQPLHSLHSSKRHDRSNNNSNNNNSMHYEHDSSQIPFSQTALSSHQRKHQYQHHLMQPPPPQQQQQSIRPHQHYYANNNNEHSSSTSFTEAHSNNHSLNKMSSLKSSQSIPSPIHLQRNKKPIRPQSKQTSQLSPSRFNNSRRNGANSNGHCIAYENDPNLFTLHGILRIMKQKDQNYQMVTLGMDLTQLGGLDLNCPEPEIHHTFLSPWLDKWDDSNKYVTPSCYKLKHSEHSPTKFMNRYKESTLFYIFYCMVNDKMQMIAAKELYARNWCFHKSLKLWLHQREEKMNKKKNKKAAAAEYEWNG